MSGEAIDLHPTVCNLCGGEVIFTSNAAVYSKEFGSGKCYLCTRCKAYVGTHEPRPTEALGILANERMRNGKKKCHALFDIHWKNTDTKTLAFIRSGFDMRVLLPQEFAAGDVCDYPYGHPTNKSQAVVEIVKILPDPRGVAEIKVLEVANDDTGNNYLTYLHRTGKTMNVSLRYCHKID